MIKRCEICSDTIDTKQEPYFKFGGKYIHDDSVNIECIVNWCGWHRKNEDKT